MKGVLIVKIRRISENTFWVKWIDSIGGTLKTVAQLDKLAGNYSAVSFYIQDVNEEISGYAESTILEEAIRVSQETLRENWIKYTQSCEECK